MKRIVLNLLFYSLIVNLNAQTFIASSRDSMATSNHNQRKMVRDSKENLYVVFTDIGDRWKVIKGMWLDRQTNFWSSPVVITEGNNPTLAIGKTGTLHLIYESNDPDTRIIRQSTGNFVQWSAPDTISSKGRMGRLPVADVDADDRLNLFWIEGFEDQSDVLKYASFENDSLKVLKSVMTKPVIDDIAIANHLTFYDNDLYFAVHGSGDSLFFFRSEGGLNKIDTTHSALGSFPCISYNSISPSGSSSNNVRFLYLDLENKITEAEKHLYSYWNSKVTKNTISTRKVESICIDDVMPAVGYSYLLTRDDTLCHGFSYGASMGFSTVLDTVTGHPFHPSIAYKNFNFQFVDFIWMEKGNNGYGIHYKRDEKYHWIRGADPEFGKGFSITGFPNPFTERLTVQIVPDNQTLLPRLEIFDRYSRSVFLYAPKYPSQQYTITWDATDLNGAELPPGVYILVTTLGDKRVARKVVLH